MVSFPQVFHIFHNGRGGWIKVERNGGKWREGNGIMIRISGIKILLYKIGLRRKFNG